MQGASLLMQPGLRRFVLIPIGANVIIFAILTFFLVQLFGDVADWTKNALPSWLSFLYTLMWWMFAFLLLLGYGYSFTLLTNIIAAPFYGLLAEKVELHVSNKGPQSESLSHMIPRTLKRELTKLVYILCWGLLVFIGLLVLSFLPPLVAVLGFLWGSWVMAIQYTDYAADNHQLPFKQLRLQLGKKIYSAWGLGGVIMLGSMVPIINIFVAPIAVAAGTLLWVERIKNDEITIEPLSVDYR